MNKKSFVAFEVEDGVLKPHDHPVFVGQVAYDLGQEQQVQINELWDVREFTSPAELFIAVTDYMREDPEPEEVTAFVILEVHEMAVPRNALKSPKSRPVVKTKAEKKPTKKNSE